MALYDLAKEVGLDRARYPFGRYIFVDHVNGSDTIGDGSAQAPYQNPSFALSQIQSGRGDIVVWLGDGTSFGIGGHRDANFINHSGVDDWAFIGVGTPRLAQPVGRQVDATTGWTFTGYYGAGLMSGAGPASMSLGDVLLLHDYEENGSPNYVNGLWNVVLTAPFAISPVTDVSTAAIEAFTSISGASNNNVLPPVVALTFDTVDVGTDQIQFQNGPSFHIATGPLRLFDGGGGLPTGLAAGTNYWVSPISAAATDTVHFYTSRADALADTSRVPITASTGGNGNTMTRAIGLQGYGAALSLRITECRNWSMIGIGFVGGAANGWSGYLVDNCSDFRIVKCAFNNAVEAYGVNGTAGEGITVAGGLPNGFNCLVEGATHNVVTTDPRLARFPSIALDANGSLEIRTPTFTSNNVDGIGRDHPVWYYGGTPREGTLLTTALLADAALEAVSPLGAVTRQNIYNLAHADAAPTATPGPGPTDSALVTLEGNFYNPASEQVVEVAFPYGAQVGTPSQDISAFVAAVSGKEDREAQPFVKRETIPQRADTVWGREPEKLTDFATVRAGTILADTRYHEKIAYRESAGNTNTVRGVDGIEGNEVSSLAAVQTLLTTTGFRIVSVVGNLVVGATDDVSDTIFIGTDPGADSITFTAGCVTTNIALTRLAITGGSAFNGRHSAEDCVYQGEITPITGMDTSLSGAIRGSNIQGEVRIPSGGVLILDEPKSTTVLGSTIRFPGAGPLTRLLVAESTGRFIVEDAVNANDVIGWTIRSGRLTLDSSINGAVIDIAGDGQLIDNKTSATSINIDDLLSLVVADAVWDEGRTGHVTVGSFGELAKFLLDQAEGRREIDTSNASQWTLVIYDVDDETASGVRKTYNLQDRTGAAINDANPLPDIFIGNLDPV